MRKGPKRPKPPKNPGPGPGGRPVVTPPPPAWQTYVPDGWINNPGWQGQQPTTPQEPEVDFNESAWATLEQMLRDYGLTSLSSWLRDRLLSGASEAEIYLELQQTNEWKTRFAGNEMLRQQGLAVLSPQEYLALERSYGQIMRNFGLPEGFYDDPGDFAKWIGNNVSAAELQQRVSAYADLAGREDPAIVAQLQSMGMGQGDLLAYMMDPDRAAPLIQRQYQTALLGGAARRAGVVADNDYLGKLAGLGITEQQAGQGYGAIGASMDDAETLSSVYGVDYGQRDMESEVFENNASAGKKRKRLASQERAAFSGSAGVGNLSRNTSGSY